MVSNDFAIKEYASGTVSDRSGSISGSDDPRPFTGTQLADVVYLNREDRVPVYRLPAGSTSRICLGRQSTWRSWSLRSSGTSAGPEEMTEGSTELSEPSALVKLGNRKLLSV